ncbi:superfamily ii helicase [Halogeometricum borinquense DSM 11551]|uniref:ATP-dependent DNA helicase Hel308 n=2 Tax=Halogeometricum borinquense TaxID=60847 RepID=E4NPX5_HALBP|nr:DEAD/DEAH box helicase [Halogeometricum borinquense]ADQ67720.1 superfamily II helicase [Halogeometricum borinquense DSM 11551]ELY23599.1 superfamily ii helicase [Halogeometricum borinquense DSM 11551]
MHVRDLPLPGRILEHYESQGIETLYPPQVAAVEAGVTEGERLVAAIPTASGKTFIAELAMLTAEGPALYIVPLRALAREKYETFAELPGVSVGISTGDFDSTDEDLADNDIVVATAEKVDSAIRTGAPWIESLACVVVDEVHLLGSDGRGPTLEVTLATLQRRAPGLQIVALSATVDNPEDIADWLDADLVETTWRPVSLRTGVYADGSVTFDDDSALGIDVEPTGPDDDDATEATAALIADAVADGGQCLAFVRSRREAESLATRLADESLADDSLAGASPNDCAELADEVSEIGATETGSRLADVVESGVAFHHAGVRSGHRALVESAFREKRLKVICATPTLAAGVNVPARRVVIRDLKRYTGEKMTWLPVLEVHQMCGRAGRPHLDPYGEAILVNDGDESDTEELWERYVTAEAEAVESKLAARDALRTHVLSVVASGFADSRDGVVDLLDATFFAHQSPDVNRARLVDSVVEELAEMEMLDDGDGNGRKDRLTATELGSAVSRQYVTPVTGARLVEGVQTAARMADENVTELTALEIICDTPDMHGTYLGNRERAAMYRFASTHAAEFTTDLGAAENFEEWLCAVKLARIFADWTAGESVEAIVENYRIGPGDLEARLERVEWLLGAADAIADVVNADLPVFREVRDRL